VQSATRSLTALLVLTGKLELMVNEKTPICKVSGAFSFWSLLRAEVIGEPEKANLGLRPSKRGIKRITMLGRGVPGVKA
jgi:hypothetical protein